MAYSIQASSSRNELRLSDVDFRLSQGGIFFDIIIGFISLKKIKW